jgi:hypothetical protein
MSAAAASPFACLGDAPRFVVVGVALLVHDEVSVEPLRELWISFEVFFNRRRVERFILAQAVSAPQRQLPPGGSSRTPLGGCGARQLGLAQQQGCRSGCPRKVGAEGGLAPGWWRSGRPGW